MNAPTLSSLRRSAILAALVLAPLAAVVAFAVSLLLQDEYQSTAKVLPPALYSALARVPIFTNEVTAERMPDQQSVRYQSDIAMSVLKSTPVLDALVKQEGLARHYATDSPRVARERLLDATRVSAGRDGVLAIQVSDANSAKAASIANAYVTGLERYVIELTNTTARARAEAIRQQLALAQQRLRELDAAFVQVQARTGIVKVSPEQSAGSANLNDLRQRLAVREAQLTAMSVYATPGNPAYVRIQAEAQALRGQIAAIVGQPRTGAAGRGGSEDEAQYQRALRDVRTGEEAVDGLRKQLAQAEFESVSKLAGLQVIERATPSEVRSGPRRLLIAGFAFLAAVLVVTLWFLWRLGRLRSASQGSGAAPAAS
ncbi:hypothetical protein FN976_26770 [Caenimonas sedimenti]|uniref:Lipopolysaccharide biosynthesis protein n=1 Tax=Caenimonas sedimenti TaxID=2596921 RepID=A0A562ZFN6_9BURK|nr:hypothetical protein [Caenimonas sedimenti]TWO66149.1 hypothetical protein FN976_26770 [Caenimonas sedimenti]